MATQKNDNMQRSGNAQKKTSGNFGGGRNTKSPGGSKTPARRNTARGTAGRGTSGKQGGGGGDSDKLINIFLVLLLVTVVVLAVLYFRKGSDEPEEPVPTQQPTPGGVTAAPEDQTQEPEEPEPSPTVTVAVTATDAPTQAPPSVEPTGQAEPTQGQQPEPTAAAEPTPVATVPPSSGIGTAEADEILADVFWEAGYRFTLSDSKFESDGVSYYRYDVSYSGKAQDYDVLVNQADGELYYYENGTRREFDGLPEHTGQPGEDGGMDMAMTADAAAELLKRFSYTSLGLPAKLDECSLMLDNWKTVVYGQECFCLNVFYNGALAGSIYFTETADHVYYLDEFGEFVEVNVKGT